MPPIEVPGHASYPSGHSTQAHLVALLLAEVLPGQLLDRNGPLQELADRIARNREVLGLHYPSDSRAGEKLAIGSFLLLRKCPTVAAIIEASRQEWDPSSAGSDNRVGAKQLLPRLAGGAERQLPEPAPQGANGSGVRRRSRTDSKLPPQRKSQGRGASAARNGG
jgi:hypothetical protein